LRTGAALRYLHPPRSVSYQLQSEKFVYPSYLGHYGLALMSVPLSAAKLFQEAVIPVETKNCSLVHSMFWSIRRYSLPWIHENDQSLGQYFSDYVRFEGPLMRGVVAVSSAMINSEKCKGAVVWSEWARNGYIADGVERAKVKVIPPAFSLPAAKKRKQRGSALNILFVGRDYERKGGGVALEVFERLKRIYSSDLRMTFVGEIADRAAARKVREDAGKSITQYDHVSKEVLHREILPSADVFLLPTVAEAYGMSVIEAMSNGVPVVSSRISAIPEVVQNGISGYLCRPGDVEGFVKVCELLLESEERRDRMGGEARKLVAEKFSPEAIGVKLYELYSNAVAAS
jgi:glycosyltransferase involved in cell wall biosynthesis